MTCDRLLLLKHCELLIVNTYCEYLIVTTRDLDNCMSLARNEDNFFFSVLTLVKRELLESQWNWVGKVKEQIFSFQGGIWCLYLTVNSKPIQ